MSGEFKRSGSARPPVTAAVGSLEGAPRVPPPRESRPLPGQEELGTTISRGHASSRLHTFGPLHAQALAPDRRMGPGYRLALWTRGLIPLATSAAGTGCPAAPPAWPSPQRPGSLNIALPLPGPRRDTERCGASGRRSLGQSFFAGKNPAARTAVMTPHAAKNKARNPTEWATTPRVL